MALASAHRGYEYQDLLVAARLVDVMLGSIEQIYIDEKLVPNDRFDDLTTVDAADRRERVQVKHTDNADQNLTLATFTNDVRRLRLDHLISAALADRDCQGTPGEQPSFRIILRDAPPTDARLLSVLHPANSDPGPFLPGMASVRMRFNSKALWEQSIKGAAESSGNEPLFGFLQRGERTITRPDLDWVCQHLVVEIAAPAASLDLTTPGAAERLLLQRVQSEVGAGVYPNVDRTTVDVAEALIRAARAARQGSLSVTASELLRRARLRSDFGAVARAHPVDRAAEVPRAPTVAELVQRATAAADNGKVLVLVGPPGQGKSWICQQLIDRFLDEKWLVAEHYCYLGDADGERLPRVLTGSIFGSLLRRISEHDPGLVSEQRPRFAATESALEKAVIAALAAEPERRVALLVDGIDHVTRVMAGGPGVDPSFALAEGLAALDLPAGSVLIVLSQPGKHLEPLETGGASTVSIPKLSDDELRFLAARQGVVPSKAPADTSIAGPPRLLGDEASCNEFLAALSQRSGGNALYATYLCREVLRHPSTMAGPSEAVLSLPQFDGSLENYYQHIQAAAGEQGAWVAEVIAFLDFPVSRSELKKIRPDLAHRVDRAVDVLQPVLLERATQAGVRIYHESFARFLRLTFQDDADARTALLGRIIKWLKDRGFFEDSRSFRYLIPLLAEAGSYEKVVEVADAKFVVKAIAAGFPASTIVKNLATAVGCASRLGDWSAVTRYVEMSRSAETYQGSEFEAAIAGHMDVIGSVLGTDIVAERLLHDGRPTMAGRTGIQVCAALDACGSIPPWREYMMAFARESEEDNASYGPESDHDTRMAWLRGRSRLASLKRGADAGSRGESSPSGGGEDREHDLYAPVDWNKLARMLDGGHLPIDEVTKAIVDTFGVPAVVELIGKLNHPGAYCLALAEEISAGTAPDTEGTVLDWALRAVEYGLPAGSASRLLAMGLDINVIDARTVMAAREHLLQLAQEVQGRPMLGETKQFYEWMDGCAVAARRDPFGLNAAEAALQGPGWYTCWLRFTISLLIAEAASPNERSRSGLEAIRILTEVEDPFLGAPRACDLYHIHSLIDETIRRAVHLLDDSDWAEALGVLSSVSDAIAATIHGELGGPFPPDRLLDLIVETATPTRRTAARRLVSEIVGNGGNGRFYSDLAEYGLVAARFELNAGDLNASRDYWTEACRLLIAYGWRRDNTIYELLDPLSALIRIDPARGRAAVARVQPLCERVLQHTDGKDTRHARSRWWQLLAEADPCALSRLVQQRLMSSCNDPKDTLHRARSGLWRTWFGRADPIVAGALRLTIEEPLDQNDLTALGLLADICDGTGCDQPSRLLIAILARIDERPYKYAHSDSSQELDRDRKRVDELNAIAARAGVPCIASLPTPAAETANPATSSDHRQGPGPTASFPDRTAMIFVSGAVGVAQAIRVWQGRQYREARPDWSVDRFANIVGYRILELVEVGREKDANTALRQIADPTGFGDSPALLKALAEGFKRHGQVALAAEAYALVWTRSRGQGGWLRFGGQTDIEALQCATELDREVALQTIAEEIEHIVRQSLGSLGITQALMHGFAKGGLGTSPSAAFEIWDAACSLIEDRLPRVAVTDDPDDVYAAPDPDDGADIPGNINAAFAAAALAGIAHAGREQKRRSLIALQYLIHDRADAIAAAIELALASLSDPATLTWLLRLIELSGDKANAIVRHSNGVLAQLIERPHLTVRTLSRKLLPGGGEFPLPRSDEPDVELLDWRPPGLLLPATATVDPEDSTNTNGMINEFAGVRLSRAESIHPRLRDAVRRRVESARTDTKRRMQTQFRAYGDQIKERWPDAFLAVNEAVEDALQRTAAGVRSARLASGRAPEDPLAFEDRLAGALIDDPSLPLVIERTRHPRPDIPPPPLGGDALWSALSCPASGNTTTSTNEKATGQDDGGLSGTAAILGAEEVPGIVGGPFGGWRLVATVEQREVPRPDRNDREDDTALRCRTIELRQSGSPEALNLPPVAKGDVLTWISTPSGILPPKEWNGSKPVIGLDTAVLAAADGCHGLGFQKLLLTPTPWLSSTIELERGTYFVLEDSEGPAVALISWRTEYETSDYHLAWPRLCGTGLVVRSDAFDRLVDTVGGDLSYRDYLQGPSTFQTETSV